MRARCSQALCNGTFTVNSRRISSIILQTLSSIFAAVPARGFDFFLGNRAYVDVRLEPIEDRVYPEVVARDRGRAGTGTVVPFADHLGEEIDAAAEIGFVAEIERAAIVPAAPAPVRE